MPFRESLRPRSLLWLGAYVTSLAGLLALAWPTFDFLNHFRGLITLGCLCFCLLGGWRSRHLIAVAAINAVLTVAPAALTAAATAGSAAAERISLKIVSFNVWTSNREWQPSARWLAEQRADVVVLQELRRDDAPKLLADLATIYPHQEVCLGKGCGMAIVSRRPFIERAVLRRGQGPPLIDVVVHDRRGRAVRVVGTHLQRPDRSVAQSRELEFLRNHLRETSRSGNPTFVAGDFNLTPWSILLTGFLRKTGLVRHGWWHGSWPSDWWHPTLFLIDHVLSSHVVRTVAIEAGPHLGSDHRPIVASFDYP